MGATGWYATREEVKRALDSAETARNNAQVDRALEGATRFIERLCHRHFYPLTATRTFDWPSRDSTGWRLWLRQHELASDDNVTLIAGGVTLDAGDYLLRPDAGPPFTHVEINLGSDGAFSAGTTSQRAISLAGVYGHSADTAPAGAIAEALDASETGVDVNGAASAALGVGSILKVDSERMVVTGRTMLDTGQNIGGNLDALASATTVPVSDGTAYAVDEVLLVDAERMLVVDIAGNNLVVKRAWDGTVLAAHTSGADIYGARWLAVERGALGTTAATHSTSAAITRALFPGPVRLLAVAEAVATLMQETAGYARTAGSGDNTRESRALGLKDLRCQVYDGYGRKGRTAAI